MLEQRIGFVEAPIGNSESQEEEKDHFCDFMRSGDFKLHYSESTRWQKRAFTKTFWLTFA
jgi:hypothetical protein